MSAENNKQGKWSFADLFADIMKEIARDITGPRRIINKDLAESMSINQTFLDFIDRERKKIFDEMMEDPDAEEDEYKDFDFDFEENDSWARKSVAKVMKYFNLPPNFKDWVCLWLSTGKKPTHLPLFDFDFLANIDEYKKSGTGITAYENRKWKKILRALELDGRITKKDRKEYLKDMSKVPINRHRKKRVKEEVLDYREKKLSNQSSKEIAYDYLDSQNPGDYSMNKNDAEKISARLRKRDSLYNRILKNIK